MSISTVKINKTMPSFNKLSFLINARLLHPKISELTLHSYIQSLKLPEENFIPCLNLPEPVRPNSIYNDLLMNPLIVTQGINGGWRVISSILSFHQARFHLHETTRIPVLVVKESTNEQINQLITYELIINKVIGLLVNQKYFIWENKKWLEKIGVLNNLGLQEHSKKMWASWLNCDKRSLRG